MSRRGLDGSSTVSLLVAGRGPLRAYWCAWLTVVVSQLVLLVLVRHPPLLDYPNHLARAYVLQHLNDVPAFHDAWISAWKPLPNLGMDLAMLALQPIFGIDVAGQIFLGLALLIGHVGCHLLGRAIHGRPTWTVLGAQFFVFNTSFLHGFVNYAVGLGVFMVALAYWLPRRRTPSWPAVAGASLLAFACYLSHLSAVVFLGLGVATFVVADLAARRIGTSAAVLAFVPFAAPLALLAWVPHGHGPIYWVSVVEKVRAVGWLFRAYSRPVDFLLAALLVVGGALLVWGRARGSQAKPATEGASQALTALVFAALLMVLYFACPTAISGTWAADRRFIYPAAMLAVLSLGFQVDRWAAFGALGAILAVTIVRSAAVGRAWSALDARIEARCQVLRGIAPGSRVFGISVGAWFNLADMAFPHVVAYAAISNHAVVPLFAQPSQQPLLSRDQVSDPHGPRPSGGRTPTPRDIDWPYVFAAYPYVWINGPDASYLNFIRRHCATVTVVEGDLLASGCRVDAAVP